MNLKLQREGENRDKIDSPLTKTFCFQSIPKSIKISHSNARRRKIISKRAIVPFIITIKNFRCPSWNKIYSIRHWAKRKAIVDEVRELVFYNKKVFNIYLSGLKPKIIFNEPVDIIVTAY